MKKISIILLSMISHWAIYAQTYSLKPTGTIADMQVVIKNLGGDLEIQGTSSQEIVIEADDYEGAPDKAKGLKPLSATGQDNTGIGLTINQEGNKIFISTASRSAMDVDYAIRLPKGVKLKVDIEHFQGGDIAISGMTNELDIQSKVGDMVFADISGPVLVNSISGDIEISFSSINPEGPSSIHAISGDVDISFPSNAKLNFDLSAISGEIYSDLDLDFGNKDGLTRMGGTKANATMNGGGVKFTVNAISGDVFMRKQ